MKEFIRRVRYRLHRGQWDAELEADMEFHREMAAQAGRANFGNMLRLREEARESWGWMWLDRLAQDVRYAARSMARSPGFSFSALLILAIGIGVNVAAFSLFNMVALKPLPVRDPASLVRLERRGPNAYDSEMAYPRFLFYREHAKTLSAAIAVLGVPPMQIDDDRTQTSSSFVTSNYFTELGAQAAYGRLLNPAADDAAASPAAVVVSYGLWQRRFGGDPHVIGRVIRLNKKPATIVGVASYALVTLGAQHPDIWLPIAQQPYFFEGSRLLADFDDSKVRMWGRLAPGVPAKTAEQELRSLTNELRRQHPRAIWDKEFLQSSPGGHLQVMQPEMYGVAAMVAVLTLLILAVACANLGALLLARAVQREREMRIRLAIGANRARIFRQLCTESLLLAALGALAGLAAGCTVIRIALARLDAPKWLSAVPDLRVLLFTLAIMFVAAVLFGFTPALQAARQRQRKTTARHVMVAAQVAASCVLLIVSGLLVRAAHHALYTDPGFGYERSVSIDAQLGAHGFSAAAANTYLEQMQTRLLALPAVRSVALVLLPPLGHAVMRERRTLRGQNLTLYPNWVSPGFFQTMQIPLLLGRNFSPREKDVTVVSQSFARAQWPGQNPLGKQIGDGPQRDTVIGVAGDAHLNALSDDDAIEQYWPLQPDQMPGAVLIARMAGSPEALPAAARRISDTIDRRLFPEIRLIKSLYNDNVRQVEQLAAVITLMGIVAVLLAGVGIVGLVSFAVWQKTKEIGIRTALGASRAQLLKGILRPFSRPVLLGLSIGTGLAAVASRTLRVTLYGISNLDPLGYAGAILMLLLILAMAAVLPARRALRINVAKALHYD